MDFKRIFKLAVKYKWVLAAIPLITLVVTFLLIKDLPNEYKSQARISTGLLDPSRQISQNSVYYSAADLAIKTNQQFTNIMDIMMMPKNMSILSYRLILHDLRNPETPFRKWSDELRALDLKKRQQVISAFEERLAIKQVLTPFSNDKFALYDLVLSMKYDEKSLKRKLGIYHEENSDFVNIEFTSENTQLSVFVVNTLSADFVDNYGLDQIENKNRSILVLDSLLKTKEAIMNSRNEDLKNYKIKNRILNLDKQSQIAYQQIADLDNKKSQAMVELKALQAALNNLNVQLNSTKQDKLLGAETIQDNQAIVSIRAKLKLAENAYIDNGFLAKDKRRVDSIQDLLNAQLSKTSDNYVNDPLIAKQSLIQRRISIGIDLDKTKASINDINNELAKLNANFSTMVPFDAGVQNYERNADVATREYLDLLNRYNQTNLDKNIGLRLQLEQMGVPTAPEPSKKVFFLAISLLASLVLCFGLLLLFSFIDNSIHDISEFEELEIGKVIGTLPYVSSFDSDIQQIWVADKNDQSAQLFKNNLRSIRFDINQSLNNNNLKVLGVAPITNNDDVFVLQSLVYAFGRLNRKVLVIGDHNVALELTKWNIPVNQTLQSTFENTALKHGQNVTFLNKDLGDLSLLENSNLENINDAFARFKQDFDLVLVQLDSLSKASDVKEWIAFTDKYLAAFNAGDSVSADDRKSLTSLKQDDKFLGWVINGVK